MYLAIFYNLVRKVIVLALLLVFAFAFPFYMIFYDAQDISEGIRTPFNTPWRTVYKTMTMAAGHLRIDSLLHQDNQPNLPDVQYPVAAFSLLILFVVLMPILFLNLLTSLAVGDIVQEIEKKSDTYRLRLRLEFTLPMENFLHSIFTFAEKRKLLPMNLLESWKKKLIIAVDKETVIHPNSNKQNSFIKQMIGYTDHFKTEATNTTEPLATKVDVKNQIKPLSEEVKELHNSVDQLLSIVKSIRNDSPGRLNI
ncbi:PREDICTED: transient receptor potential cation channel subfamily A member 1-like [Amphimedon queenslandica]|uniref:Ion transport domain-containing protein n=1 Tax=Amphimedon queenslandica TaxID=400682 RepID=A0AAN0JXR5_AMPQE|nr:PREDICTED: transient receptor potential cation channel subfamily A member 1-like [Amphimedon queenslandica]|eukprot:XP_019861987.1 PREDICTED: transient receptor potential cation channel subfamily A member 1-like [Amphimedon queenslandica]